MRLPFAWAFVASLLLLFMRHAGAQVQEHRCEPRPIGPAATSTYSHVETVAGVGEWAVHFCETPCAWAAQISYVLDGHRLAFPSAASQAGMTARELYREVYRINATIPPNDPRVRPLVEAALRWANANEPPQPACVVHPARAGDTTRLAHFLDHRGQLGHVSPNRAPVGARCNCLPGQRLIGSGSTATRCAWKGAQIEPNTEVAVCRPAP